MSPIVFKLIDGAVVITYLGGVYRQSDVYIRNHTLFAKHGAGFVKLYGTGATSLPKMTWADLDLTGSGMEQSAGSLGELTAFQRR